MTSMNLAEWSKELRTLLDLIRSHPSDNWTKERHRIAVLNKLLAGAKAEAAA